MKDDLKQIFKSPDSDSSNENVIVIKKSGGGVISSVVFSAILPILFFSLPYFIYSTFGHRMTSISNIIMSFNNATYYLGISVIFFIITILKVLAFIFDSLMINIEKKEIYFKGLWVEETFSDITSVNFSRLPIPYMNLLTFYNRSGQRLQFSNFKNEQMVKNITKLFSQQ